MFRPAMNQSLTATEPVKGQTLAGVNRSWRRSLCAVLAVWLMLLSGPVAIAHGGVDVGGNFSNITVAMNDGGSQEKQPPAHDGSAQHCAVCQLSQALPARSSAAMVKQLFTGVTYAAANAPDAADFAPPPLRKPPRA